MYFQAITSKKNSKSGKQWKGKHIFFRLVGEIEQFCRFDDSRKWLTIFYLWSWYCGCCCCWVASVVSDSVWPHRRQPTRLPHLWDSPGRNTGVGCHFLLQRMKVKSESEVAQSCPTLHDPMDCSPPRSSIHGISQARVLKWGAIAFSIILWEILKKGFIPFNDILWKIYKRSKCLEFASK